MTDTLGGRIAEARKSAGRTQEWLGEQTDSNRGSVIAWEKPDGNPSSKNLQKIIAALGVSGHWLITGEGTMRDTPHQNAQTLGRMQALMRDHLSATQDPQDQNVGTCVLDTDLRFVEVNEWLAVLALTFEAAPRGENLLGEVFGGVVAGIAPCPGWGGVERPTASPAEAIPRLGFSRAPRAGCRQCMTATHAEAKTHTILSTAGRAVHSANPTPSPLNSMSPIILPAFGHMARRSLGEELPLHDRGSGRERDAAERCDSLRYCLGSVRW